jgi:hypothetical protein
MSCCDWETFSEAFKVAFERKNAGLALIDWKRARRDWKRHHCTGGEAASMQLRDLAEEGEYLFLIRPNRRGGNGDGGIVIKPKPCPVNS